MSRDFERRDRDCQHNLVHFISSDWAIECQACGCRWVLFPDDYIRHSPQIPDRWSLQAAIRDEKRDFALVEGGQLRAWEKIVQGAIEHNGHCPVCDAVKDLTPEYRP